MAELVLLSLQTMVIASIWWLAARVRRLSKLASLATKRAQAPSQWESRLAELAADVSSLSSSFEKVTTAVNRQNQRDVMRERRSAAKTVDAPPPVGAPKGELRRYYGLTGAGPEFARQQLQLVPKE